MKVRMLTGVTGSYYYCPTGGGYQHGVERGQIVELDKEAARHEIAAGRVELTTEGPVGRAFDEGFIRHQLAKLGK